MWLTLAFQTLHAEPLHPQKREAKVSQHHLKQRRPRKPNFPCARWIRKGLNWLFPSYSALSVGYFDEIFLETQHINGIYVFLHKSLSSAFWCSRVKMSCPAWAFLAITKNCKTRSTTEHLCTAEMDQTYAHLILLRWWDFLVVSFRSFANQSRKCHLSARSVSKISRTNFCSVSPCQWNEGKLLGDIPSDARGIPIGLRRLNWLNETSSRNYVFCKKQEKVCQTERQPWRKNTPRSQTWQSEGTKNEMQKLKTLLQPNIQRRLKQSANHCRSALRNRAAGGPTPFICKVRKNLKALETCGGGCIFPFKPALLEIQRSARSIDSSWPFPLHAFAWNHVDNVVICCANVFWAGQRKWSCCQWTLAHPPSIKWCCLNLLRHHYLDPSCQGTSVALLQSSMAPKLESLELEC